jgi:signal recognition particle GTPase
MSHIIAARTRNKHQTLKFYLQFFKKVVIIFPLNFSGNSRIAVMNKISIEQYLEQVARFSGSDYGKMIREQFEDIQGASELAMLVSPSAEELEQLKKAVAIMTPEERQNADTLTDEQTERLAVDAQIDPANLAIFLNGYALHCKRVS